MKMAQIPTFTIKWLNVLYNFNLLNNDFEPFLTLFYSDNLS